MKITWKDWLLAVLSGASTALAFPRPGLSFLAWVSLIPLLFVLGRHAGRQCFFLSFAAGLVFYGILLYWIPAVPEHYAKLSPTVSFLIFLVLIVLLSLFWGLFGLMFGSIRTRRQWLAFVLAPFTWVGIEYLLTLVLTGFPWGLLGNSQYRDLPFIQVSTLTGVFGVSFLLVLLQSMFVLSITLKDRRPFFAGLALFLLAHGVGALALRKVRPTAESFTAGVIQGNIPPDLRWDQLGAQQVQGLFRGHIDLTRQAVKQGAQLVVWPEFSVPLCFSCSDPLSAEFQHELNRFVRTTKTTLVLGTIEVSDAGERTQYANSALCLAPDQPPSQYAKMHLVPFGEYTPYPAIFSWVRGIAPAIGQITPGRSFTFHNFRNLRFATPICYEIIFPELVRRFVKYGANFLVTLTNDGWYGRSWAPDQHFAIAVLRAVENRRFLLRAATTGVSGIIDPYGRILSRSQLMTADALTQTITPRRTATFYTRNGDWLAQAGLTLSFVFFMLAVLTRPHERRQRRDGAGRPII